MIENYFVSDKNAPKHIDCFKESIGLLEEAKSSLIYAEEHYFFEKGKNFDPELSSEIRKSYQEFDSLTKRLEDILKYTNYINKEPDWD